VPPTRAPLAPHRLAAIAIEEREAVQKPTELTELLAIVAELRPRRVVEIGSYRGGTLWAFAQVATSDAILVSVDLPGGDFGGGSDDAWQARYANFVRHDQRIVTLPLDSHEEATVDAVREALGGAPVDFLFIDGDHRYEGVKRDFELFSPLVRPGGVVAFHDILPDNDYENSDVDMLWTELRGRYRSVELIAEDEGLAMGRWAGIGALWI
jgi:predicted O-methyltransferase YrrM